jgi:hypothetical protein
MILQPANLDAMEVEALQTDRYLDALLAAVERRAADVPADATVDPTLRRAARRLRDELVRTHPSFRFEERLARRLADAAVRMRLATAAGGEAEAALIPFPTPLLADPMLAAELANPELAALLGVREAVVPTGDEADTSSMADTGAMAAGVEADAGAMAADPSARATTAEPGRSAAAADTATFTPSNAFAAPLRPAGPRPLFVGGALTSAALSLAGAAFVAWRLSRGAPADPMARAVRAARAAREAATATTTRLTAAGVSSAASPLRTRTGAHTGNAAPRPGRLA